MDHILGRRLPIKVKIFGRATTVQAPRNTLVAGNVHESALALHKHFAISQALSKLGANAALNGILHVDGLYRGVQEHPPPSTFSVKKVDSRGQDCNIITVKRLQTKGRCVGSSFTGRMHQRLQYYRVDTL